MRNEINIVIAVDVIAALSGRTLLNSNLCMMDDSPLQSTGQGTPNLCTVCYPGQTIKWTVYAIDLQTPVAIKSISFIKSEETGASSEQAAPANEDDSDRLDLEVWSGIVPCTLVPGVEYRYRLELQMYEGVNSIMSIDTPSLKRV